MQQRAVFFVIRARRNLAFRRLYSKKVDRASGVVCDQIGLFTAPNGAEDYPIQIRRIRYHDAEMNKTLIFLTNNVTLPPQSIALLYKKRWQVELFFKWIRQHLRIKHFLGTTENAVKTQIWSAIATYLLIAIIKKELKLEASLYTLLQILSVSLLEKTHISCALQPGDYKADEEASCNQLNLLGF